MSPTKKRTARGRATHRLTDSDSDTDDSLDDDDFFDDDGYDDYDDYDGEEDEDDRDPWANVGAGDAEDFGDEVEEEEEEEEEEESLVSQLRDRLRKDSEEEEDGRKTYRARQMNAMCKLFLACKDMTKSQVLMGNRGIHNIDKHFTYDRSEISKMVMRGQPNCPENLDDRAEYVVTSAPPCATPRGGRIPIPPLGSTTMMSYSSLRSKRYSSLVALRLIRSRTSQTISIQSDVSTSSSSSFNEH
jgi:hypothetical protein